MPINNLIRPKPGQLIVIAGGPVMGKTSFLINWANTLDRSAYFSYEHCAREIEDRLPPDVLIFDDFRAKVEDIKNYCMEIRGLEAIFIDCLQLIPSPGKLHGREDELQNLIWRLKNLAMELNLPVIVTSKLKPVIREDRRPQLSDFLEAKQIAIYADVIGLLYRDPNSQSVVELSFIKNDNGSLGRVEMEWRDGVFFGQ